MWKLTLEVNETLETCFLDNGNRELRHFYLIVQGNQIGCFWP